jgi:PAS domain S-box-containing protein
VSSGYEEIWGQPLEEIQETHEAGFFGTLHPQDTGEYRALIDRIVAEVESGDGEERYTTEYRIERPDGEVRWVHSDFYPTEWRDEDPRIVIVSRDVTERKTRQGELESFHDATAALTTAETVVEASKVAVEAAADVFDVPATAIYHYDEASARLDPVATGPELPEPADLEALSAETDPAWGPFVDGTMETVEVAERSALGVEVASRALLVPLGGNGLLAVWGSPDSLDAEAASILAASLEAALNRLRGERRLESRREELREQTERARRLEAITEVTQRVEAAITSQSSRRGMYDAVCAELVDLDRFGGAWIAAAEVGTDRLTPRTVAGVERDHAERALVTGDDAADPHPAVAAWRNGNPKAVADLVGSGRRSSWRQRLLRDGAGSVCAVPLTHSGITYGVLVVVADEPDAFGDREIDVLEQLGASIGYANSAIERKRALESDDTLELEFRGSGLDIPLARLARAADCHVRHERTIHRQNDGLSVYYTLREGVPDDVGSVAESALSGEIEVVSTSEDAAVVERRGSSWFGSLVSEHGGILRRGLATGETLELVVELPREADSRTIVERLQDDFPALELTAQRHHRETEPEPGALRGRLEQCLTERQYEALEIAHTMGYFDWPRESSGEAVANRLDITQPTVNKHIRLAEQKVIDLLFGQGDLPRE